MREDYRTIKNRYDVAVRGAFNHEIFRDARSLPGYVDGLHGQLARYMPLPGGFLNDSPESGLTH